MAASSRTSLSNEPVSSALGSRANGTTDAEVERVSKALARLRSVAAEAVARQPDRVAPFDEALRALADG